MKVTFPTLTLWQLLIVIALGCAIYSGTFQAPFMADDSGYIQTNPVVRDNVYFLHPLMAREPSLELDSNMRQHWPSRYFTFLSFRLNYALGALNVTGYHMLNLLIHLLNACALYALCALTLRLVSKDAQECEALGFVPFMAAILFVSHPVQSNAVTYISQRFAALSTLFYLTSMLSYAFARHLGGRGYFAYGACVVAASMGVFTKETVYTLPAAIVLYELVFFRGPRLRRMLLSAPVWGIAVAGVLILRWVKPLDINLTSASELYSRTQYAATSMRVMLTYLRLLVFPVNLRFNYDYPLYRSFSDPAVMGSIACVLGLLACGVLLVARNRRPAYRAAGFGILWFFLALLMETSVFPLADLIFEHRLYLPMAGAAMALCFGVAGLVHARATWLTRLLPWGALAVSLVLGAATYERNKTWLDPVTFWRDSVRKSPYKATSHCDLGHALLSAGDTEGAIAEFKKSLEIDKAYLPAYLNLGAGYGMVGRYDEALEVFMAAAIKYPDNAKAAYGLGAAYTKKKMYPEAAREFRRVLAITPYDSAAAKALDAVEQQLRQ